MMLITFKKLMLITITETYLVPPRVHTTMMLITAICTVVFLITAELLGHTVLIVAGELLRWTSTIWRQQDIQLKRPCTYTTMILIGGMSAHTTNTIHMKCIITPPPLLKEGCYNVDILHGHFSSSDPSSQSFSPSHFQVLTMHLAGMVHRNSVSGLQLLSGESRDKLVIAFKSQTLTSLNKWVNSQHLCANWVTITRIFASLQYVVWGVFKLWS